MHRQTDRTTTVTLAAHARRGLMTVYCIYPQRSRVPEWERELRRRLLLAPDGTEANDYCNPRCACAPRVNDCILYISTEISGPRMGEGVEAAPAARPRRNRGKVPDSRLPSLCGHRQRCRCHGHGVAAALWDLPFRL